MRDVRRTARAAILALALSPLAGCDARPAVGPVVESDPLSRLGPGIHPVLVVAERGPGGTRVELRLKLVEVAAEIAGFQGELRWSGAAARLEHAEVAAGSVGAWNQAAPGRLRFAAASAAGFGDAPVLMLRFAPGASIGAESFTLSMEEVVARDGLADITAAVATRAHPLVVDGTE